MTKISNKWKVYIHVSKIDGRLYCGITSQDIQSRWQYGNGYKGCTHFSKAIKKYGWDNFYHIVLLSAGTKQEAMELEKTIIRICKLQDSEFGFNICNGGDDVKQVSEEAKQHLHDIFYRSASPKAKMIVLFDYNGNRLQTFGSASECADFLNISISSLMRYVKTDSNAFRRRYFIRYYDDVGEIKHLHTVDMLKEKYKYTGRALKVNQYSLDGKYLATYRSIVEAADKTGVHKNDISTCARGSKCHGKYLKKTAGGFMWKYYAGETSDIKPFHNDCEKKVLQIDANTGAVLNSYDTIKEAIESNPGVTRSNISNALRSKSHYGKGYKWIAA